MPIKALDEAVKVWQAPGDMVAMWAQSELKARHEKLIAGWVDEYDPDLIADLGCGAGRFAGVLEFAEYYGFDGSSAMLEIAEKENRGKHPACAKLAFSLADIFNYSSDRSYDALLMIDVAQHQNEPVDSILRVMELWKARRYYISLLVGDIREDLFASTVASYTDLLRLPDTHTIQRMYTERFGVERFGWVFMELTKGIAYKNTEQ